MVSKRFVKGFVLVLGLLAVNMLQAQQDVLLPFMKTDQFGFGEKIKESDPRFRELNKEMGLYQPETVPLTFMGLTATECLVSIEKGEITRIVLFVSESESGKHALDAMKSQLDKLNVKKGEDGVDHFWRSSKLEIIHQEGMGSDVIYMQPLSGNSEDPNPENAD